MTEHGAIEPSGEVATFLSAMHHAADSGEGLNAVVPATAATLLGLDALTLSMLTHDGTLELLWADPANRLGATLDDLQYTLGEGPALDAAHLGHTVSTPNLAADPVTRWPAFTPAALHTPARAVIATPLALGASTLAVLTGYNTTPGPFPFQQRHDIGRFARAALRLLLNTPLHTLPTGTRRHHGLALHRAEIHQATGIVAIQLGVPLGHALARLRAHAYHHDQALLHTARDVIAHRLRLDSS